MAANSSDIFGQALRRFIPVPSLGGRLLISIFCFLLSAFASQARITYDFDNGKLRGWHNVKVSTAKAGYYDLSFQLVEDEHDDHAEDGEFFLGQNENYDERWVHWSKWPEPGSGVHQTVWIESPAFKLDGSGPLTYYGSGLDGPINPATGQRDMSLVGLTVPDIAGTWGAECGSDPSTTGIIAVGLRDVATGQFVLSKNFQGWRFKLHSFTAEELAPFANNNRAYTLNVVDALCGASAWCAIDRVVIPGKLVVPEPTGFFLGGLGMGALALGIGGTVFMMRRRK